MVEVKVKVMVKLKTKFDGKVTQNTCTYTVVLLHTSLMGDAR